MIGNRQPARRIGKHRPRRQIGRAALPELGSRRANRLVIENPQTEAERVWHGPVSSRRLAGAQFLRRTLAQAMGQCKVMPAGGKLPAMAYL
jgi:hypothetical protein